MASEGNIETLKCVVLGKYGVGSKSLISTLVGKKFPSETELITLMIDGMSPSDYHVLHQVNNQKFDITFWFSHGGEDYDRLRPVLYPGADVFLLTFAINDRTSLAKIQDFYHPQIRNFCGKNVPIVLCGTKVDIKDSDTYESSGCVTNEEGKQVATSLETVGYVECSAKELIGLQLILDLACRTGFDFNQSLKKKDERKTKCQIL